MVERQLHPGIKKAWIISGIIPIGFISIFAGFWVSAFFQSLRGIRQGVSLPELLIGFIIAFVILFSIQIIWAVMAYNRWLYEFTDTNLKIERGIIWKRYSNIPYERVQNVDIHRGIFARILGYSTVMIQTAGYSGFYGKYGHQGIGAEGSLPAVGIDEAEQIRDFLMKKISRRSKSGL